MELLNGLFLIFGLFVTVIAIPSTDLEEWNTFKLKYGKTYQNETEEKFRMEIFLKNKHKIEEHNQQFKNGSATYEMGLNEYSDRSSDEFMIQMANKVDQMDLLGSTNNGNRKMTWNDCNYYFNGSHKSSFSLNHHDYFRYYLHLKRDNLYEISDLPFSIDWRNEGAVNVVVPRQGNCGSCSIFSGIAAIEGQYFRKTGKLVRLSEQNVIDCSKICDCNGCWLAQVYQYVMENGGVNKADLYPHKCGKKGVCEYIPNDTNVKIHGCMRVPRGNENELKAALATIGPIAVSFDAEHKFHQYSSGIYYDPKCRSNNFRHSVLLVGYGTTKNGEDYYIARNSWGPYWGEGGYFKIARNRNNHCGIATEAVFPVI